MSLIGGNFSPFRQPAGDVPFFCALYAHATGDIMVSGYVNSTMVHDYQSSGTIAPYERFVNLVSATDCTQNDNCSGSVPCESWICNSPNMDATVTSPQYTLVGSPGTPPIAPQTFAAGPAVNMAVCHKRGYKNVAAKRYWHGSFGWITPDKTQTYCAGGGGGVCDASNPSQYDPVPLSSYVPYQSAPDTTKYLTLTSSVTYASTSATNTSESTVNATLSGSTTVDKLSGEVTTTMESTEVDTVASGGAPVVQHDISYGVDYAVTPHTYGNGTVVDIWSAANVQGGNNPGPGGVSLETQINDFNGLICQALANASDNPVTSYTFLPAVNASSSSYNSNNYATSTGGLVIVVDTDGHTLTYAITVGWSRTNTVYSFNFSYSVTYSYTTFTTPSTTLSVSGTLTLSNPWTAADLKTDVYNNLLATWPLNDDSLYPWRTDGTTNIMPKVTRLEWPNEISLFAYTIGPNSGFGQTVNDLTDPITDSSGKAAFSTGWTPTYGQRAWFDPNIYAWGFAPGQSSANHASTGLVKMFDGSIQGAPKPAGYSGWFDFNFQDWQACCQTNIESGSSSTVWYQYGYGQKTPTNLGSGVYLPANATQWTNWFEAMNKPTFGALLAYEDTKTVSSPTDKNCAWNGAAADGAFWAIKWAEIGETYQSINFARPAGYDKFLLDENEVLCFGSKSGNVVTLTAYDGSQPASIPYTTADIVGGACVGGFFAVTSVNNTAGTVTLGVQKFSVPSDWTTPSGDQSTAFGRLRFPAAPSLLGRISIAAVADAGSHAPFSTGWTPTYQFATAQTNFGLPWSSGSATLVETVDLYDQSMTLLSGSGGITATRSSDLIFTVTTSYPTAAYVMIHGAAAYQYCDNFPKGDFCYLEWLYDWRTNGEVNRLSGATDCSGHTPPSGSPTTDNTGYASFTATQDSLPIMSCHPRVACFSPNNEIWPNGITYDFPSAWTLDATYGSKWQAQIVWSITDPLWQAPHRPCGLTTDPDTDAPIAWTMDSAGTCPADGSGIHYYALSPMVEARATVPAGFPAMPSGLELGFATPVGTAGCCPNGTNPPGLAGYTITGAGAPNNLLTPWSLAVELCDTIAAGGCRFNYQNWFVDC